MAGDGLMDSGRQGERRRGELEITEVNRAYLERDQLLVEILGRGFAWLDTGTHESLPEASTFIETTPGPQDRLHRRGGYRQGYIDANQLKLLAKPMGKNGYGQYLLSILAE